MRFKKIILPFTLILLGFSVLSAQATLTHDVYVKNGNPSENNQELKVKAGTASKHVAYLKFDLSNYSGVTISGATLQLETQGSGAGQVKLYAASDVDGNGNVWTESAGFDYSDRPTYTTVGDADRIDLSFSESGTIKTWTLNPSIFNSKIVTDNGVRRLTIAVETSSTTLISFASKGYNGGANKAVFTVTATCSDGSMNGEETGNDCGGPCPSCGGGGGNTAPTVTFSTPMNGATFTEGDDIDVAVNASDSDGSVTGVELYIGTTLIGNDDAAPYQWNAVDHTELQNMAIGTYQLKAIATDDDNATKEETITITVEAANGGGGGSSCQQWSGNCNSTDAIARAGKITLGENNNSTGNRFEVVNGNGDINFQIKEDGYTYARDIQVSLSSFPDYIFEDTHDLLSIKDLNNYIKENKHLPNVPSGEEIDENGIGLGELNIIQMEKIEELTLYIIQLNERLEKLEQENKELRSESRDN